MKTASATFPPSRVEPAVASATETADVDRASQLKGKDLRQMYQTPVNATGEAASTEEHEQTHSVGMNGCRRSRHKEMAAFYFWVWLETTSVAVLAFSQRLTQRTHLPTHGCQSTQGWLQDISLSQYVRTFTHFLRSSKARMMMGGGGGSFGFSGAWGGSTEDPGLMDTQQWRQFQPPFSLLLDPLPHSWQLMIAARLCFYTIL